jgi:hypothetical protein
MELGLSPWQLPHKWRQLSLPLLNVLKIKLDPAALQSERNDRLEACSNGFCTKFSYYSELLQLQNSCKQAFEYTLASKKQQQQQQ